MTKVVQRMSAHTLNSTVEHPHFKTAMPEMISQPPSAEQIDKGRYISSINLSSADTWSFPLQTLPRPTGKATQVIMTTYELPRADAAPHRRVLLARVCCRSAASRAGGSRASDSSTVVASRGAIVCANSSPLFENAATS